MDCEETPYTPSDFPIALEKNNMECKWENEQPHPIKGLTGFHKKNPEDTSGLMQLMESTTTEQNLNL